jgi:hypothetical protein
METTYGLRGFQFIQSFVMGFTWREKKEDPVLNKGSITLAIFDHLTDAPHGLLHQRTTAITVAALNKHCDLFHVERFGWISHPPEGTICFCRLVSCLAYPSECDGIENVTSIQKNSIDPRWFRQARIASLPSWSASHADKATPVRWASCRALEFPGYRFWTACITITVIRWSHHIFVLDVLTLLVGRIALHDEFRFNDVHFQLYD